jgi:Xaa-Pro dipeptidase
MTDPIEVERRYGRVRGAMAAAGLDALVVCGSEYTGFEGAVRYMCGFRILHRWAYVLVPLEGDPVCVFPAEARWVGVHDETFIERREFVEAPGAWMREALGESGAKRVGVYGLDYVLPVHEYRALDEGDYELIGFDHEFDAARAVKSDAEMDSVRESMAINEAGFWALLDAYEPGRTEAELMGAAEDAFVSRGTTRLTMDMVLAGPKGAMAPRMRHPSDRKVSADDLLMYGLEVAGPGGHWVEFSRPICGGALDPETETLLEAYREYHAAAKATAHAGSSAHELHTAVSAPFHSRGFQLGHVTGHSIGMTMIEFPRIGEGQDVELQENMVLSLHPHAITEGERACMYMQDTWRVGETTGESLSEIELRVFGSTEST